MPDLEVIDGGGDGEPPIRTRKTDRARRYCPHNRFELQAPRRVVCADCEEEVDAFAALQTIAHGIERYTDARDRAKAEARRANDELEAVKRELRNAKARLRRASR